MKIYVDDYKLKNDILDTNAINKAISIYSNDAAVAAYTAIAYVAFIVCRLFNGIADGAQPLMSYYHGCNDKKSKNTVLNYSIILSFALMVISTAAVILFKNQLQYVFGLSDEGKEIFKSLLYYNSKIDKLFIYQIIVII